ncbi:hypothetical protein A3740_17530 [Oleiphilus sp. HI0068]|uniref:hypothetical protein n=1 Tax=unclassified Oleiphilus TaxID=2631174 RepID=UPI0007C2FDE7|nr:MULTISPECIES: hypothetical protein [unclassified Oleiphilus]KZY74105.1 hypothetical protein A3740_17530 [Oleiphilus sp. HI0068]KZY81073.1 hypothetical protein A3741_17940 [Oleiphilus sp. HI0069]KZY86104.1 hypothetical protein A3743_17635 [Oleiphilus sp. HI0072]KZZ46749.1 hypothetical protein A3755_17810 [Oleiphilus sp. HI0085]KZY34366.1 hypothetical protein A3729_18325 [Oleiphilus sp. HI0043]
MEFQSNTDLFDAIEGLQASLVSTGNEHASNQIADGLSSLNGLTDGWAQLLESINNARCEFGSALTEEQTNQINKIQSAVHKIVYRA